MSTPRGSATVRQFRSCGEATNNFPEVIGTSTAVFSFPKPAPGNTFLPPSSEVKTGQSEVRKLFPGGASTNHHFFLINVSASDTV
jgi:hypothetical protein